eukprot:4798121-Pleurochrysis_carterae.AAC.1
MAYTNTRILTSRLGCRWQRFICNLEVARTTLEACSLDPVDVCRSSQNSARQTADSRHRLGPWSPISSMYISSTYPITITYQPPCTPAPWARAQAHAAGRCSDPSMMRLF